MWLHGSLSSRSAGSRSVVGSNDASSPMSFNTTAIAGSGEGVSSLAKSVLASVKKKAEDKDLQQTVCNYLHGLDTTQITNLPSTSIAGMPILDSFIFALRLN